MRENQQEIQQNFIRIAKQISSELLAERDDILAIYIYGSVGRGEATPHSDLDLHVVLDMEKNAPDHEDRIMGGITAGISYHTKFIYVADLQALASFPNRLKDAARWEGLWELADALPIHDPKELVSKTQANAAILCQNPELIQLRTQLSLNRASETLTKVEDFLNQERYMDAYVCLYHLTGGDGNPGVVPLLAKSIIQRAGLALTTRRYIYRAYQACEKLSRLDSYTELVGLLGIKANNSDYVSLVRKHLLDAYDFAKSLFESVINSNTGVPPIPLNEETRALFVAAHFDEICMYASSDAAIGLAVGYSTRFLVNYDCSKALWLNEVSEIDAHQLLRATMKIAGIEGDIPSILKERLKLAENWLKAFAEETAEG